MKNVTEILRAAITAVAPHGPTPIVAIAIGGVALLTLAAGADPQAVVGITLLTFAVYIYGQERSAKWRREQLRADYEGLQRTDGVDVTRKLKRRLQQNREKEQPTLFDEKG